MNEKMLKVDLETLRRSIDDITPRNRLISLPDRARSGFITFGRSAKDLIANVPAGKWMKWDDPLFLEAGQTQMSVERLKRLAQVSNALRNKLGVETLMIGYGIVTWRDDKIVRTAPLVMSNVNLWEKNGEYHIRIAAHAEINQALLTKLGMMPAMFPENPLDYVPNPNGEGQIIHIEDAATLGIFSFARMHLRDRLEVKLHDRLRTSAILSRLLKQGETTEWPVAPAIDQQRKIHALVPMDEFQNKIVISAREGQNILVEGPPGTGKTQVMANIIHSAITSEKRVLVISDNTSALRAINARLDSPGAAGTKLQIFGHYTGYDANKDRIENAQSESILDGLRRLTRAQRPHVIITTTYGYIMDVPEEWTFDLLVIDEASQVPFANVAPAISASTQLVICGDTQQMPPSNMLQQIVDSMSSNAPTLSVLDVARGANMPSQRLKQHYRSRHPGLIHASNKIFYESGLRIVPSPHSAHKYGLQVTRVAGVYDRRGGQTNPIEAEMLLDEVERVQASDPESSILIIAMTDTQRDLIYRRALERHIDLSPKHSEPLLIVDSDNVQGEERDVVLISLTFAPDKPGGRAPTSFGPISLPGGDQRLNVTMTRARYTTRLFSSVTSAEIARGKSAGQNALIVYLDVAEKRTAWKGRRYDDVLTETLKQAQCACTTYGQIMAIYDLGGRSVAAIYVTGKQHPLTEQSEIQQLMNCGWKVTKISAETLEACREDIAKSDPLMEEIQEFRISL